MKTTMFAPCYLGEDRLERNIKWLNYYEPLLSKLNVNNLYLIDNGSRLEDLELLGGHVVTPEWTTIIPPTSRPYLTVVHFPDHIPRSAWDNYEYWWRAMDWGFNKIRDKFNYDKVIHIDTDVYILKQKVIDLINGLDTGWNAFWSKIYAFPETTFQVLCKDSFNLTEEYLNLEPEYSKYNGKVAEDIIPFTNVIKDLIGDRYGEQGLNQGPAMDYYAQAEIRSTFTFYGQSR